MISGWLTVACLSYKILLKSVSFFSKVEMLDRHIETHIGWNRIIKMCAGEVIEETAT
jgi:hypothetical protein